MIKTKEPWSHTCSQNPMVRAERDISYQMLEDLIKPIKNGQEHRVPRWLLRRIKRVEGVSTEWDAIDCLRDWLDHWGTIKVCGIQVLVSEPYLDFHGEQQQKIHDLAEKYGCRAIIFPTGIWCLTTHRVVFVPQNWDTTVGGIEETHWVNRVGGEKLNYPAR